MNIKEFDRMNQKLIDGYIERLKNKCYMVTDDSLSSFRPLYRISACPEWVGRDIYYPLHRKDAIYIAHGDITQTEIRKIKLINFNIVDMVIERIIVKNCSVMNGTFKNTKFFSFSIAGSPGSYPGENEYQEFRSIVMNCIFENCVFMNSYAEHTDWINCQFINCIFINSNLNGRGFENKDCKFDNCKTIYLKA